MTRMGLLLIITVGLIAMIVIAKLAAKTRPYDEVNKGSDDRIDAHSKPIDPIIQKGLINLLIKKKMIGEEELLEEIKQAKDKP